MTPLVLLSLAAGLTPEEAFRRGVELRGDAATARPYFASAAAGFAYPRNRGKAYFLAGNVPLAVAAYREALAETPWDADVQRELALVRAAVPYPTEAAPEERVRPDPPTGWRNRVSPTDRLALAVASAGLLAVGLGARFTVRPGWAVPVALLGAAGGASTVTLAWQVHVEATRDATEPAAVLANPAVLRTGNADVYPARVAAPLPAGAEVRVIGRRGGWAKVRLHGGAVGWLAEPTLMR